MEYLFASSRGVSRLVGPPYESSSSIDANPLRCSSQNISISHALQKSLGESKAGYPGYFGSIDAMKIGWDKCLQLLSPLYKGKEGYPTVVFQVSCNQQRFIHTIGKVQLGTRNDKMTVRYKETVMVMHSGNHDYKRLVWYTYDIQGNDVEHRGLYWICGSGYLGLPCLLGADKNSSNPMVAALAGIHGGVQKDVECLFGICNLLEFASNASIG
jgi:hypothetical protein